MPPQARRTIQAGRICAAVLLVIVWLHPNRGEWLFAGQDESSPIVAHFQAAQKATQAGDLAHAVKEYKTVLRLDPTLAEARINLGLAYHMLGDYELAVSELANGLRARPKVPGANIILGIDYLKLGSFQKAIAPLQQAIALDPANREALRGLAAAYLALHDYHQADGVFRRVFSLEQDKEQAWFGLGHDYLDMTKQLTGRMALEHRDSAWRHRLAGDMLAQRGLWNDAAHEYKLALSLQPAERGLHASLGDTLLQAGSPSEAEDEFRSELCLDPGSLEAQAGLAAIDLAKGDAAQAREKISKVIETSPEFLARADAFPSLKLPADLGGKLISDLEHSPSGPATSFLLWVVQEALGKTAQADELRKSFASQVAALESTQARSSSAKDLQQACATHDAAACIRLLQSRKGLAPSDYLTLGKSRLALGQTEDAAGDFADALAKEPHNPEALFWLIRAYTGLSESCFNQLMADFPDSWRAHQLKAETDVLRQADPEAIAEYEKAAQLHPDEPALHQALGELYLAKNSLDRAGDELEKALQLNPLDPRSLYLMGNWCIAQRQPQKAIPFLERAVHLEPALLEARASLGKAYLRTAQPARAVPELEKVIAIDHYGDLHYLLYQAYRELGKTELAQTALAKSQELRRQSVAEDQAKIQYSRENP